MDLKPSVEPAAPGQRDWAPELSPTFWVNHASRLAMRAYEQELRPLGLGMAYRPVAVALQESGTLTQTDLTAISRAERPTMAALLVRMARDAIIARNKSATDRRSADIALTEAGRLALAGARGRRGQIVDRALEGV